MSKQKCCRKKAHRPANITINGERICCGESRRKYKCPVPPPPCEFVDSQASLSLYFTPTSRHHNDERGPKTSKARRKHYKKIDVHITDRSSRKCSEPIKMPVFKVNQCCSNDYVDKMPPAYGIPCTDSTISSSDDLSIRDQRTMIRNCKPKQQCVPPPPPCPIFPKSCCKPVILPQQGKKQVGKECCSGGGKICVSVRPKSPVRGGACLPIKICEPVKKERRTKDCTVQTEICQSHKACQVYSRINVATIDTTAQTEMLRRAEKECQSGKSHWDRNNDKCLQTEQEESDEEDGDDDYRRLGTRYERPPRVQGHAFPFAGESPSGYLKVAKHMVAFENRNLGILVADPTKTRLWHKELLDCDEQPNRGKNRCRNSSPHKKEAINQSWHYSPKQYQYDDRKALQKEQKRDSPVYYSPDERENKGENFLDQAMLDKTKFMDIMPTQDKATKLHNIPVRDNSNKDVVNPRAPHPQQLKKLQAKESELSLHDIPTSVEPSTSNLSPPQKGSGEYVHAEQHGHEINAAITIQRHVKGHLARKQYKKIKHSAKVIQDAYRGHWARKQQRMQGNLNNTTSGAESTSHPTPHDYHSHPILTVGPYLQHDLKVPREGLLVLGGSDPTQPISEKTTTNTGKEILMYSINSMTWTNVGALPEPRTHFGIAKMGYEVYIIGGTDPRYKTLNDRNVAVKSVWKVHLKTGEWYFDSSHPRHLDNPRSHFGCAGKKGSIYIFGGNDAESRALSTCQRYDTLYNSWTPIKSLLDGPRVSMGVAVFEDHIWIAGGITKNPDKPVLKSVIYYDTVTDSWTIAQSLPLPRAFPTLVVAHGKLFLLGGAGPRNKKSKNQSSVPEILVLTKITAEEWREVGALVVARHGHAAVAIDHQIVVLGGVSSEHMGAIDSVEIFDLSTSHSQKVKSLYENLSGMGAVSLHE